MYLSPAHRRDARYLHGRLWGRSANGNQPASYRDIHAGPDRYCYAHSSDCYTDRDSNPYLCPANRNPGSNGNAYGYPDAHADPDPYSHSFTDANVDAHSNGHGYTDADRHADASSKHHVLGAATVSIYRVRPLRAYPTITDESQRPRSDAPCPVRTQLHHQPSLCGRGTTDYPARRLGASRHHRPH